MYFYWFRSIFLAHTTFPIIHCVLSFIFLVSEQFFGKFFSIVTKLKSSVLSLLFYYLRKVINKHNKNKITHRLQDSMIFFDQLKAVEQRSWLNRRMLSFTIYCDTFQMYCPSCCLGILFQHPASQQYNFINSFSQTRWKLLKSTFLGHWRALSVAYNTSFSTDFRVFWVPCLLLASPEPHCCVPTHQQLYLGACESVNEDNSKQIHQWKKANS